MAILPSAYNQLRFGQLNFEIRNPPLDQLVQALQGAISAASPRSGVSVSLSNGSKVSTFEMIARSRNTQNNTTTPSNSPVSISNNNSSALKDSFTITYKDAYGQDKRWNFALLPAIENTLRPNNSTAGVPEVKPGILVRTGMNFKRFLIPGGPPVFQALGIEETFYQLVGAFIGAETNNGQEANPQAVYNINTSLNAYDSAMLFDKEVVQTAREVHLSILAGSGKRGFPIIDTPIQINVYGIVQNIRYFGVRHDRTYYAIDFRVTRYPNTPTNRRLPETRIEDMDRARLPIYDINRMDRQPPPQRTSYNFPAMPNRG